MAKPRSRKSIVWQFYNRLEHNGRPYAVICELCNVEYKFFGNTTNLRSHLSKKHPIQWELATTGALDESTSKSFQEPANDDDETDDENQREEDDASINLLKSMQKDSDEEWLEDPFETVEVAPKRKIKRVVIKREMESPENIQALRKKVKYTSKNNSKSTYENPIIISNAKDEYTVFGEYVAGKVRRFSNPKTRGNIQQLITTILWQAEYGMYDSAESIKNVLMMTTDTRRPSASEANLPNSVVSEASETNLPNNVVSEASETNLPDNELREYVVEVCENQED